MKKLVSFIQNFCEFTKSSPSLQNILSDEKCNAKPSAPFEARKVRVVFYFSKIPFLGCANLRTIKNLLNKQHRYVFLTKLIVVGGRLGHPEKERGVSQLAGLLTD